MKVLLGVAGLIGAASAHTVFTHFHINGVANKDCVRQAKSVNPITDLSSDFMACNDVKGNAKSKCVVKGKTHPHPHPIQSCILTIEGDSRR